MEWETENTETDTKLREQFSYYLWGKKKQVLGEVIYVFHVAYILLFPFSLNRFPATVRRPVGRTVVFTIKLESDT